MMKSAKRYPVFHKKQFMLYGILILCALVTVIFVNNNDKYYSRTIGTVIHAEDEHRNTKSIKGETAASYQKLTILVNNGSYKGEKLEIDNEYSYSRAYDDRYKQGDKLFLSIEKSAGNALSGKITGVKRDFYIAVMAWLFIILIIMVGGRRGLFSILSLVLNILLFSFALDIYRRGIDLLPVCGIIAIIFTVLSLLIVSGNNKKTCAAIAATLLGTISSLLISYIAILVTKGQGLRYEEMQFITHPPDEIFLAEILVGALGAIMDISITIASSIYELYHKNPDIQTKELISSGTEIGKDIMGTMINVLFFAYVSGTIPMILLYMKNGIPIMNAFYSNLSLELVRALTGSIGIVLTIPIALHTTIFFLRGKRIKA